MSFRERALFSLVPFLAALLFNYKYITAPARVDLHMPGAQVILAKPVLSPPPPKGADITSVLSSSKTTISFRDPRTGASLGWHTYCQPYPSACSELLAHQNTPLEVTLVPGRQRYLISNYTEGWLIQAQAGGKAIVSVNEQAQAYAQERRRERIRLMVFYLIALGTFAYAKWGPD